jgi:hypothetical protein
MRWRMTIGWKNESDRKAMEQNGGGIVTVQNFLKDVSLNFQGELGQQVDIYMYSFIILNSD